IGGSAALNLDLREEISVVVAVKNQGTGTGWLLSFAHLWRRKHRYLSVEVLNQEHAAHSHRSHGQLTCRNSLVPEDKVERHLGCDLGAAQLRKRSTSRNQHQREDQHCTLHKTLLTGPRYFQSQ